MIRNLVLTIALAGAAFAQGPRRMEAGPPKALAEYLGLTDDQVTRLTNMNRDAFRQARPEPQQMREKARALRQAMESPNPDPAAVGRAMLEMRQSRKAVRDAMGLARQNALSVLTEEQRTKLVALENARKLQPAIGEAMRLHLLAPPAEGDGPGFGGFGRGFGPFRRGPGGPPRF